MADSLSNAAGKGVTLTIRGKEYKINPLTVRDLAEFEAYVRSKRLRMFLGESGNMPVEERAKIVRELCGQPPTDTEVAAEMSTLDGVRFLLWKALARSDPALTLDSVGDLVGVDNLNEVSGVLQAVSGTDEENPTGPPAAPSATGGTSTRKHWKRVGNNTIPTKTLGILGCG